MLGALLIMAVITIANMRRGVLLHKMILLEVRWTLEVTPMLKYPELGEGPTILQGCTGPQY